MGLVGIKRRGVPLAQRLAVLIEKIEKHPVDTGCAGISASIATTFDRWTSPEGEPRGDRV